MYLIGGADTSKSLCNTLEIIDFDYDMIESKACQRCRDIYGQKVDSRDNLKPLMIKYEHVPRRK